MQLKALAVIVAVALLSSACASAAPTVNPSIFNTSVAQTVEADYTRTAEARPTATPTGTATPTEMPTATPTATQTEMPTATITPTIEIRLPIMPRATFTLWDISWGGSETWCPARGENVTCETEYRNYSGNCVVGMTCYDACGFYYAVNTLPAGGGSYIFSGPCY